MGFGIFGTVLGLFFGALVGGALFGLAGAGAGLPAGAALGALASRLFQAAAAKKREEDAGSEK